MYEKQTLTDPSVAVIVLAYKGWQDTVLCLESLLRSTYSSFKIIVVDNCSPDDSWTMIQDWAAGSRVVESDGSALSYLYEPPFPKPISHCALTQLTAEKETLSSFEFKVTFIRASKNKGFSAGNNIGIRYAQRQGFYQYVWLLNNDTVVKPDTLSQLIKAMKSAPSRTGIMGAKLLYYHNPTVVQCLGGATYNSWLGYVKQIGNGQSDGVEFGKYNIDYVCGASMLVSVEFINAVGLLDEEYFLYFEEIDWTIRGKRAGWCISYSLDAVVYHREGGMGRKDFRSDLVDFYYIRNRLLFTYKNYDSLHMITVYVTTLLIVLKRILNNRFSRIRMVIHIMNNFKKDYDDYLLKV